FRLRDSAYNWAWNIHTTEYIDPVLEKLYGKGFRLSERRKNEIDITLLELVSNSSTHACEESENQYIEYTVYFGTNGIVAQIKDDGPGFDHQAELRKRQSMGQPSDEELLGDGLKSGTGLFCLLRYSNGFQYNDEGNEVAVRFEVPK
ncbi:MAG: ATP-binding protein, partial [Nanoarchaeota archaeon]|nr:ATP-binding protein [Nanoarchaeota archaeon]